MKDEIRSQVEELEEKREKVKGAGKLGDYDGPLEKFERDSPNEEFRNRVEDLGMKLRELRAEIQETVKGQETAVDSVLKAVITDGNVLLEGVPGLGKSLLIETLGESIENADFNRIQFVPDMLPSDILGQRVYNQKKGEFYVNKGPVFTNFLLADEINRAPPKTQAALMEVMQEKKVSIEDKKFDLEPPYVVLATQNPLEQKGTYPLPEAIIDRFFMKIKLDIPDRDNEKMILRENTLVERDLLEDIDSLLDKDEILDAQEIVRDVYVSETIEDYILNIVDHCRGNTDKKLDSLKYIEEGPSPRASIWLSLGASANALLDQRSFVIPKDVKDVAKPILRHRVSLDYEARIRDIDPEQVIDTVLSHVEPV